MEMSLITLRPTGNGLLHIDAQGSIALSRVEWQCNNSKIYIGEINGSDDTTVKIKVFSPKGTLTYPEE